MQKPAIPLVVSAFLALAWISSPVAAQYPEKPVRLVVPYAPGGGTDSIARLLAEKLAARLGQPVIVENKGGASGIIGSDAVAKAPPDGYTLLLAGVGPLAVSPSLFQKAPYQPTKDFVPIVKVSSAAMVLVTASKKPGEGLKELVEYARNRPGQLTIANAGDGSAQHICAAMFTRSAGITVNHIAYKGAANAITDLLGGNVQAFCDNVGTVRPFIQSGKLKPLAVSTRKRAEALPDVPTFESQGLRGIDFSLWFMLVAPKGTPVEVVTRLNNEVNAILKQPDVIQKLHDNGSEPAGGPATSANQFLAKENAALLEMVSAIGLTKH